MATILRNRRVESKDIAWAIPETNTVPKKGWLLALFPKPIQKTVLTPPETKKVEPPTKPPLQKPNVPLPSWWQSVRESPERESLISRVFLLVEMGYKRICIS